MGASFWAALRQAVIDADLDADEASVLAALWDLVWAGEVTNDTLAPLRAHVAGGGRRRGGSTGGAARRPVARRARPRLGRPAAAGPPSAAGRWSLVDPWREPRPSPGEIAVARAHQLLERHGVLTREAARGEGIEGGFAGVYPVLRAMEDKGTVRRGYFVAGLGAAQFALPGAVDRLRAGRSERAVVAGTTGGPKAAPGTGPAAPGRTVPAGIGWGRDDEVAPHGGWGDERWAGFPGSDGPDGTDDPAGPDGPAGPGDPDGPGGHGGTVERTLVLAATDPGQPYGAALPWPESDGRPSRSAGSHVVLREGRLLAWIDRAGRTVVRFTAPRPVAGDPVTAAPPVGSSAGGGSVGGEPERGHHDDRAWVEALAAWARRRGIAAEVRTVDGVPVRDSGALGALLAAGFVDSYRGVVLRR